MQNYINASKIKLQVFSITSNSKNLTFKFLSHFLSQHHQILFSSSSIHIIIHHMSFSSKSNNINFHQLSQKLQKCSHHHRWLCIFLCQKHVIHGLFYPQDFNIQKSVQIVEKSSKNIIGYRHRWTQFSCFASYSTSDWHGVYYKSVSFMESFNLVINNIIRFRPPTCELEHLESKQTKNWKTQIVTALCLPSLNTHSLCILFNLSNFQKLKNGDFSASWHPNIIKFHVIVIFSLWYIHQKQSLHKIIENSHYPLFQSEWFQNCFHHNLCWVRISMNQVSCHSIFIKLRKHHHNIFEMSKN